MAGFVRPPPALLQPSSTVVADLGDGLYERSTLMDRSLVCLEINYATWSGRHVWRCKRIRAMKENAMKDSDDESKGL